MKQPMLLFATERYQEICEDISGAGDFDLGVVERKVFPDGERYRRVETDCALRDVAVVGGTVDDVDMLEIYDLACGLVHLGAHTLTLVLPWFGYQTMERASRRGEIVAAKNRARLLSSIPSAGSGNRVVLIDLHSEGIPQYFSGDIRPVHLQARSVVLQAIRDFGGEDFVLGATDAGRAKWVESLANDLLVDAAFVFKRRLSETQTEITALAADVEDRPVVIYDDMIRTGGYLRCQRLSRSRRKRGVRGVHPRCVRAEIARTDPRKRSPGGHRLHEHEATRPGLCRRRLPAGVLGSGFDRAVLVGKRLTLALTLALALTLLLASWRHGPHVLNQLPDLLRRQQLSERWHRRWIAAGDELGDSCVVDAFLPGRAREAQLDLRAPAPVGAVTTRAVALPQEVANREVGTVLLRHAIAID